MTLKLLFWAITLVDVAIAVIIFVSALSSRMLDIPLWYRIGLLITAFGFTVQGCLNLPYLLFNVILMAQELPFWILKDVGIGIISIYYFWHTMHKVDKPEKTPARKKSAVAKKTLFAKKIPAAKKTPTPRAPRKKTPAQ
ncbi:hypothetical protein PF050_20745 [Kosakonia pseudosacchari]|uniref:hypothetical protein n=1 Tax=Kosakonia pseudosacchari TaxID=1646340 RepID=UPI0022F0455E|nr:hypothetical protein [Kosakonia pseudosacchari]WBU48850.1 hypothetical protein PF050_20745 [Kosakonia pseudosacchari]